MPTNTIDALAKNIDASLQNFEWDHILFSYHGIPERHLRKSDCKTVETSCQNQPCPVNAACVRQCYRAQCYETTRHVAKKMEISPSKYSVGFQSRLGRTPWIKPYTDEMLTDLHRQGVRNLAVVCPSFLIDCLETVEEIGMRLREDWLALDGTTFHRIECLNSDSGWVDALSRIVSDL